jgi:curli production assembly/transport component CsgF
MKKQTTVGACCALLAMSTYSGALAQQLVYTPINPQFGGNPFNATQLEEDAAVSKPAPKTTSTTQTQAQEFATQLQSQLYADLANQVTQAIFGPNAQNSGTFSFGGETVSFTNALGEITVNITDASGTKTQIQLPTTSSGTTSVTGG